jgi:hypothetical protein
MPRPQGRKASDLSRIAPDETVKELPREVESDTFDEEVGVNRTEQERRRKFQNSSLGHWPKHQYETLTDGTPVSHQSSQGSQVFTSLQRSYASGLLRYSGTIHGSRSVTSERRRSAPIKIPFPPKASIRLQRGPHDWEEVEPDTADSASDTFPNFSPHSETSQKMMIYEDWPWKKEKAETTVQKDESSPLDIGHEAAELLLAKFDLPVHSVGSETKEYIPDRRESYRRLAQMASMEANMARLQIPWDSSAVDANNFVGSVREARRRHVNIRRFST